jgi:hypothetical protein
MSKGNPSPSVATRFKPGRSGNPGGRPRECFELKELARKHTAEAVERLVHWLRSDDARASVTAAQALLDRGYGRPTSHLEHTGADGNALRIELIDPTDRGAAIPARVVAVDAERVPVDTVTSVTEVF